MQLNPRELKMKKTVALSFLLSIVATSAYAADPVQLTVKLMEGDKLLNSTTISTIEGQSAPIDVGREIPYTANAMKEAGKVVLIPGTAKDGFFMRMTPTLKKDGQIEVEFNAHKMTVTSISDYKMGDVTIQLPQVSSVELKGAIDLAEGKEASIPFGPIKASSQGGATQYTLKLVAVKI